MHSLLVFRMKFVHHKLDSTLICNISDGIVRLPVPKLIHRTFITMLLWNELSIDKNNVNEYVFLDSNRTVRMYSEDAFFPLGKHFRQVDVSRFVYVIPDLSPGGTWFAILVPKRCFLCLTLKRKNIFFLNLIFGLANVRISSTVHTPYRASLSASKKPRFTARSNRIRLTYDSSGFPTVFL